MNNSVNKFDPDGYWALAITGGYLVTAGSVGVTNAWNPIGWIVLGTVAITATIIVRVAIYNSVKSSSDPDPYARPGQKKQGRERKSKARKNKKWKSRTTPKAPKKHTPGRGHRKYK